MIIVGKESNYLSIKEWYSKLAIIENQVCRIEVSTARNGTTLGTGFLIGPDLILTSYHLIKDYKEEFDSGINKLPINFRFDYLEIDKSIPSIEGVQHSSHKDNWLVAYSELKLNDFPNLSMDGLDYAIIKTNKKPGFDKLGSSKSLRGWVEISDSEMKFENEGALSIIHHPNGKMMRLSINTNSIVEVNESNTRILHKTHTSKGSSGAPCFNLKWEMIGMQLGADYEKKLNVTVSIKAIITELKRSNIIEQIFQKSPHQKFILGYSFNDNSESNFQFPIDPGILKKIKEGENKTTEFKESWLLDRHKKTAKNPQKIIQEVAGFLNSEGGILFIGINDDGEITGIQDEYEIADKHKKNSDGYELKLTNMLLDKLGEKATFMKYDIRILPYKSLQICAIIIEKADEPVFYEKQLHVRIGTICKKLETEEAMNYTKKRWKS